MFEDQNNKTTPPSNLPVEPDDMFAEVDKTTNQAPSDMSADKTPDALGAGLLKKKEAIASNSAPVNNTSPTPMAAAPALYEMKQPILGKILLSILVLVIVGGVGFGAWYGYNKFFVHNDAMVLPTATENAPIQNVEVPQTNTNEVATETQQLAPVESATSSATSSDVTAKMNNDKILFGEAIDSDKDGLDDVREKELGTDPYNADTDNDGLNDGDEVIIWKTNPLNPDTDGDSYKDGEEVLHGYNPLGPGKLFNVPEGASTTTASTSSAAAKK